MKEIKGFTPGKWKYIEDGFVVDEKGKEICQTWTREKWQNEAIDFDNYVANGKFIASAPDLYAENAILKNENRLMSNYLQINDLEQLENQEINRLQSENAKLREVVKAQTQMLKELQWENLGSADNDWKQCIYCERILLAGCEPNCKLTNAIKLGESALGEGK